MIIMAILHQRFRFEHHVTYQKYQINKTKQNIGNWTTFKTLFQNFYVPVYLIV